MKSLQKYFQRFASSTNPVGQYDVIIIGGGPGGYVASIKAAQMGKSVACIEKRGSLGGTCLNVGCIPSKTLLHASELYHDMEKNFEKQYGIVVNDFSYDLDLIRSQKEKVIQGLTTGIEHLFKKNGVDYYKGFGKILDSEVDDFEVEIDLLLEEVDEGDGLSGETVNIIAENIIIATGSVVQEYGGLEIDERVIISSDGALEIERIPDKMAVIGVGAIGLELGSVYQRYGSQVTVIYYKDKNFFARYLDPALRNPFLKSLKKQGMKFKLGHEVTSAEVNFEEENCVLNYTDLKKDEEKSEEFDAVLVSTGRVPFFDGLGLEELGIELTDGNRINVDETFQTNVEGIFAIGDCIEGPMLAHKAEEDGVKTVEYIVDGVKPHVDHKMIPNVIYTDPEVACVGYNELELQEMGVEYRVGTFDFQGNSRARAILKSQGMVKIIGDAETDKVLGLHILGPCASEMIMEGVLFMEIGETVTSMAHACHPHPAFCEAIKEAALDCVGSAIHK